MFCGTKWYALAAVLGLFVGAPRRAEAGIVLIDFNALAQDEEVTTQFSALGVTFSGLFGDTSDAPTVAVANLSSTDPEIHTMVATFIAPIMQAGFDLVVNGLTDTISVSIFRSGTFLGAGAFFPDPFSVPPPISAIINSPPGGFDRIEIDASSNTFNLPKSGAVIDNFFFEAPVIAAVPEPGTFALTGIGFGAAGLVGLRRRGRRNPA